MYLNRLKIARPMPQYGASLIEVMITIFILGFGLLGVAMIQDRIHLLNQESYQRGQALVLANDIAERLNANRDNAASYSSSGLSPAYFGVGDSQPSSCLALSGAARDVCEWSALLKGAAQSSGGSALATVAAARGCITQIQAANSTTGNCQAGIYQIDVVWQGRSALFSPPASVTCGKDLYPSEYYRRWVSTRIGVGVPTCG